MIVVTDAPTDSDRAAIVDGLVAFNVAQVGPSGFRPFAALLKDGEGRTVGGAVGFSSYGWLFVDYLFLPDDLRGLGLGGAVMRHVEAEARARGCLGVHLRTASFQAPGFYESLGFTRVGTLPDRPPGHDDHWYAKRLDDHGDS